MSEPTNKTIAEFMKAELDRTKWLYQQDIVTKIQQRFGKQFVYFNKNGGLAIGKGVLQEFNKLTPDCVWERHQKCWRKRETWDTGEKRGQF